MNTITDSFALKACPVSILEAAKQYISEGMKVVPDMPKSKKPAVNGWTVLNIQYEDVPKHFQADSNISVLLGNSSGGVVCLDIDAPIALRVKQLLPQTNRVHGRQGMPGSHLWFRCVNESCPSLTFKDSDGTMILEILGDKRKITSPPSIHETGEQIGWDSYGAIASIEYSELVRQAGWAAGAAILAMHWPKKGARQEAALALAGALLRGKFAVEDAVTFIRVTAKAAGDEEHESRAGCVKSTAAKLSGGEPVTGKKRLTEIFGKPLIDRLSDWLQLEDSPDSACEDAVQNALEKMNLRHAVIQISGSTVIMNREYDPVFRRYYETFSNENAFKLRYKNKRVQVFDETLGKQKVRTLAELWLEWGHRKQYDGIEFSPNGSTPGFWNLFQGFPVKPQPGNCDLYLEHLKKVICCGNESAFDYVLRWMAHAIQKPGERPETAIVLRGKQGVGKGVAVDLFGSLFGAHYLTLYSHSQVSGRFNSHLKNVLLLHLNEALWGGKKESAGMLKGLITDPTVPIEAKGKDIYSIANYIRIIVASNETWAVPLDLDDRRFLILDASDEHKEDHVYFSAIMKQMLEEGGVSALMHTLTNLDLSDFNIRKLPAGSSSLDIKLQSADSIAQWWYHFLKESSANSWIVEPAKAFLHEQYLDWCKTYKATHPLTLELFSKMLKKYVPGLGSVKKTSHQNPVPMRIACFQLPGIEQCRKSFEGLLKAGPEIWE